MISLIKILSEIKMINQVTPEMVIELRDLVIKDLTGVHDFNYDKVDEWDNLCNKYGWKLWYENYFSKNNKIGINSFYNYLENKGDLKNFYKDALKLK